MSLILAEIKNYGQPIGAAMLSRRIHMPPATIGKILAKLEDQGLLEKVSNKGRLLTKAGHDFLRKENTRQTVINSANKLYHMAESISEKGLIEILEVRKLLECKAAEMACINATDEDIAELDTIFFGYVCEINHGGLGDEQDLKFHLKIAEISKQTYLYNLLKIVLLEKDAYAKLAVAIHSQITKYMVDHEKLLEAIKNRCPEQGKLSMERHLDHLLEVVNDLAAGTVN